MKILFLTNLPSPYRVDFFNELGKYCELTVCFERRTARDRDIRWNSDSPINYSAHFTSAKQLGSDKTIGLGLIREIKNVAFDYLIIAGYSSPSVILAIVYCRLHKINYIIESDGGFSKSDSGLKKLLKIFLLCGAVSHFTTCEEYISYLLSLGIPREKIYKYPFTSLKEQDIAKTPATEDEKCKLRKELGIKENKMVLSVGQFIPRKGFDVLIKAAKDFPYDTGAYIIGGIPGDEYIQLKEKLGLKNVHFIDFKQKEELKKWYRAADVFVLPTREDVWGLVINEAMAQGLPIITTNRCIAGLELVMPNYNGFIVQVNDIKQLHNAILKLYSDEGVMQMFGNNSLEIIKNHTIEKMCSVHCEFLNNGIDIQESAYTE